MRCEVCRFFAPLGPGVGYDGECRWRPPILGQVRESYGGFSYWPGVKRDDFCGEFEAKEKP